jgi:hypothetical protein
MAGQMLSPETEGSGDHGLPMDSFNPGHGQHPLGSAGAGGMQMIPDLTTVTDMILPMSPRTLLFDSYDENMPLFPTVDTSMIQLEEYQLEDVHTDNLMLNPLG